MNIYLAGVVLEMGIDLEIFSERESQSIIFILGAI